MQQIENRTKIDRFDKQISSTFNEFDGRMRQLQKDLEIAKFEMLSIVLKEWGTPDSSGKIAHDFKKGEWNAALKKCDFNPKKAYDLIEG